MAQHDKQNMTIDSFLEIYGIKRGVYYSEVKKGKLHPVKLGKNTFIKRVEADRWLETLGKET